MLGFCANDLSRQFWSLIKIHYFPNGVDGIECDDAHHHWQEQQSAVTDRLGVSNRFRNFNLSPALFNRVFEFSNPMLEGSLGPLLELRTAKDLVLVHHNVFNAPF